MKRITTIIVVIIFCSFCSQNSYSQAGDTVYVRSFRHLIDSIYGKLDSNLIPTKALISRVPFSEKIKFADGTLNDSVHSYVDWCFYYNIMSNASLREFEIDDYLTIDSISESRIKNTGIISLGFLNFNYNEFKDSVFYKNLVLYNGTDLVNSPSGTTANTYTTGKLFSISPLAFAAESGSVNFILKQDEVFSNDTSQVVDYAVSIDDGVSYSSFSINSSFNLGLNVVGPQVLLFRIIFKNTDTLYSTTSIYVANQQTNTSLFSVMINDPDEGPKNIYSRCYSASDDTYGKYAVWYGCGNTSGEIRKPIIISSGFNPAKGKALTLSGIGQILYPTELPSIYEGWRGLYFETYDGVRNKFSLTGGAGEGNGLNFLQNMRARGYDVIILQYLNDNDDISGVDYVENNACVLEELIRVVNIRKHSNPVKPSNHENVVVGYSAGALGSRYALAHMEVEHNAYFPDPFYPNHHTRIWISQEGENQGSNTPIGLQMFVKFMKEINITHSSNDIINRFLCKSTLKILETPIAKQNTYFHQSQLSGPSVNGPHPDFHTTMNNFTSLTVGPAPNMMGYPLNCRRVGMSAGNGIGIWNDVDVNADLAHYDSHLNYFQVGANYTIGKEATAYYIKNASNSIVFNYNLYMKPFMMPQVNYWINDFPKNVHVGNAGLLDNCPGSILASNYQLFDYFSQNFFTSLDRNFDYPQFCPTTSALDLHDPNNGYQIADISSVSPNNLDLLYINTNTKGYNNNFGYPHIKHPNDHYKITPFDAVYAIGIHDPDFRDNQFHVEDPQISQGDFLLDEIAPRSLQLSNRTIGAAEYYFADFEALDTITAGYNVYTTNLYTPYGDFSYEAYGGGEFRAGKKIVLKAGFSSKAGSTFRAYIDDNMCDYLVVGKQPGSSTQTPVNDKNTIENSLVRPPYAETASSAKRSKKNSIKSNNSIVAYPNPVIYNEITLDWGNNNNSLECQIYIYSNTGQLVQTITNQTLPFLYNTNKLPPGLYNIVLINNKNKFSTKFVKE